MLAQKQRILSDKQKEMLKAHAFKKGQSGNPGGIPKHGRIDAVIREELEKVDSETGQTRKHRLILAMYEEALKGNVNAAVFLADRGWGKPKESIDLEVTQTNLIEFTRAVYEARHKGFNRTTVDLANEPD